MAPLWCTILCPQQKGTSRKTDHNEVDHRKLHRGKSKSCEHICENVQISSRTENNNKQSKTGEKTAASSNISLFVLKIGWLPINERRDLKLLKSCFKALHNAETWPDYLKIIKQECPKELRSSNSIRLVVPTENGTFQDNASKLFNNLPETIRNCKD